MYSITSFIYKYKTSTLNPLVKPCYVLNLAVQNIFYIQSYVESTFTYNPGSTKNNVFALKRSHQWRYKKYSETLGTQKFDAILHWKRLHKRSFVSLISKRWRIGDNQKQFKRSVTESGNWPKYFKRKMGILFTDCSFATAWS